MQAFCIVLCEEQEESVTFTESTNCLFLCIYASGSQEKNEHNQNPTGKKHVKKD